MTSTTSAQPSRLKLYLWPLAIGFVLRFAVLPFANVHNPELYEYGYIARNILAGHGYAWTWHLPSGDSATYTTAYMPPGEVYIQYTSLKVFGDSLAGYIGIFAIQVITGLGLILLAGRIAREMFKSERMELLALWLAALYPSFVYATATFGIATSVLFIDTLVFWLGLMLGKKLREGKQILPWAIAFGISGGLLGYFRAEAPLTLAGITLAVLYLNRASLKQAIPIIAVAGLSTVAVLSPWAIRNYNVFHKLILSSSSGGFNFWRGHNPYASGSSWNAEGGAIWTDDSMWTEMMPSGKLNSNIENIWSSYHQHAANVWIKQQPMHELLITFKKVALLWGIDWYNKLARNIGYIILYIVTLISAIRGIIEIRRKHLARGNPSLKDGLAIIAVWCIIYTIVVMIFFSVPRFQVLLIGVYFPLVVVGANAFIERLWKPREVTISNSASRERTKAKVVELS